MLRTMKRGDQGPDVKEVQNALNAKVPAGVKPVPVTSDFDEATEAAVKAFQTRVGLTDNGVVEEKTRAALFPLVVYSVSVVGKRADAKGDWLLPPLRSPDWSKLQLPGLPAPLPTLATPAPTGFHLDNVQLQGGEQHSFAPWLQRRPPSPNPSDSMFLTVQGVFLRSSDDRHLEITPGVTLQGPLSTPAGDANNWTMQYFVQLTAADMFWHFDRVHLASPFAQFSFQHGLGYPPANPTVGVGLFPFNVSVDLIRSKSGDPVLSVLGQAGVVGSWNFANGHGEIGPQVGVGLSFQFGAKK